MSQTFGIDLGTTNSVIARLVDGVPVAVTVGDQLTVPSVVMFRGDQVIVGREAVNLELEFPTQTVRSIKRKMGKPGAVADVGLTQLSPEVVSAEILKALKRGAEQSTGAEVKDVVITVPAYFDDAQRRATLEAGRLAGLEVLRLLNEPTSASLVYDRVGPTDQNAELLLVYDLGGGTFDVSVLEVFDGVREVRSTTGNTHLGGDDFDELLVRRFLDELRLAQQVDLREDRRAMARLRRLAEETKIKLSSDTRVAISEQFLSTLGGKPIHFETAVTRTEFEGLIRPLIESTVELSKRAVADARLEAGGLGKVCLVGGSTRIPLVRELLAEALKVDVHAEVDVDLAVGLGAAVQAGVLKNERLDRILVDVASHSLGIRVVGRNDYLGLEAPDTFAPIVHRNTVLPVIRAEEFFTIQDEQERLDVEVFQGESARVSKNSRVGQFGFDLEPRPEGSAVRVEFAYDLNGVIRVSVSQPGTTNSKTVALSTARASSATMSSTTTRAPSALEKKAVALAEKLKGPQRAHLDTLIQAYQTATGTAREAAEEALLDFFLTLEA
jgi:molecular chaperone DnaK